MLDLSVGDPYDAVLGALVGENLAPPGLQGGPERLDVFVVAGGAACGDVVYQRGRRSGVVGEIQVPKPMPWLTDATYRYWVPGPRDYTQTTRAALATLSRGSCYFPGCGRPVIVFEDGEPYVDVHIAHICDAKVGNRHDPSMSEDERRAFANLILLCKPHHDLVDKRHPDRFTAEDLRSWKSEREAAQGLIIDDADAFDERHIDDALAAAALFAVDQGYFNLGGTGGGAFGAGGGGGGVLGSGTGGPGGPGGPIYVGDEVRISLTGSPGTSPGAGGGGAGLLLPDALARQPAPGEGREGVGYSAGVDGQDGQASSFGDPAEDVFLEAPGGKGALAGDGLRLRSDALRLSVLTLANSIEIRDNLLFLLGAGWQSLSILNLGATIRLAVILVLEAGRVDPGEYTVRLSVEDPAGQTASTVSFPVTVETAGDVLRIPRLVQIGVTFTSFGVWWITAESDAGRLGALDLMVKRTGAS